MNDLYIESFNGVDIDKLISALFDLCKNKSKFIDDIKNIGIENIKVSWEDRNLGKEVLIEVNNNQPDIKEEKEEILFPSDGLYAFEDNHNEYIKEQNMYLNNTLNNSHSFSKAKEDTDENINNEQETSLFPPDSLYAFEEGLDIYLNDINTSNRQYEGVDINNSINSQQTSNEEHYTPIDETDNIIMSLNVNEKIKIDARTIYQIINNTKKETQPDSNYKDTNINDIVKIISVCYLIDMLDVDKIMTTSVNVGGGIIRDEFNNYPIPTPQVASLLKGIPVCFFEENKELTGINEAAILKYFCEDYSDKCNMVYKKIGYGYSKNTNTPTNYLRIFLGHINN